VPIFPYEMWNSLSFEIEPSKASDPEKPRGIGWGGMWGGLKDVLDTCVPVAY